VLLREWMKKADLCIIFSIDLSTFTSFSMRSVQTKRFYTKGRKSNNNQNG